MTTLQEAAMTAERATFFLRRFKSEEKMLWPNEQAAIDFALAALAQQVEPVAWVDADKGVIVGVPRLYSDGSQDEIPLYAAAPAPQPAQTKQVLENLEQLTAPQSAHECTRSHPHELMNGYCELRTEIARLTNENSRLKAAPQPAQGDRVVDKAWAQFCGLMGEKSPYPGMIDAFELHYAQSFKDKDWRNEASVWAQAWKAALQSAQPAVKTLETMAAEAALEQDAELKQPAQGYNADPSCTTVALAEMILSDCGCSSNNTALVSRVANRIDAHMQSAQPVAAQYTDVVSDGGMDPRNPAHETKGKS